MASLFLWASLIFLISACWASVDPGTAWWQVMQIATAGIVAWADVSTCRWQNVQSKPRSCTCVVCGKAIGCSGPSSELKITGVPNQAEITQMRASSCYNCCNQTSNTQHRTEKHLLAGGLLYLKIAWDQIAAVLGIGRKLCFRSSSRARSS